MVIETCTSNLDMKTESKTSLIHLWYQNAGTFTSCKWWRWNRWAVTLGNPVCPPDANRRMRRAPVPSPQNGEKTTVVRAV